MSTVTVGPILASQECAKFMNYVTFSETSQVSVSMSVRLVLSECLYDVDVV